jgi:hypothetical protein
VNARYCLPNCFGHRFWLILVDVVATVFGVEWHLRQRLAPMLYDDADRATAEALRASVVAKAQRSPSSIAKQTHGTSPDGLPVHSLQTLLADLTCRLALWRCEALWQIRCFVRVLGFEAAWCRHAK